MGVVSTLAGTGAIGDMDGMGNVARFKYPTGVAVGSAGVVYVADSQNHRIRKITSGGVVSTLAGTGIRDDGTVGGGFMDGAGNIAQFSNPYGIAVDSVGVVYVADSQNHRIRKITSGGVVSTLAGTGIKDDGTVGGGFMDDAGNVAQFRSPTGIAVDSVGVIYVADISNNRIRKITVSGTTSEVSTLAGEGTTTGTPCPGTTGTTITCRDGAGSLAQFNRPGGIAVDGANNVYVTDLSNNRIRKIITKIPTIDPICTHGTASTIKIFTANTEKCISCDSGFSLDGELCRKEFDPICTNGPDPLPSTAKVFTANTEKCVSCDSGFGLDGELCRKEFDPMCMNGVVSTAKVFTANTEKCVSCDNYRVLKNDETCAAVTVETLVGGNTGGGTTCAGTGRTSMCRDGTGNSAQFNQPRGVVVDHAGNVYVADAGNNRIRKMTVSGTMNKVIAWAGAGTGTAGFMDSVAPALAPQFNYPTSVAVDSAGNVYVADAGNNRIRKITPNGMVSTLAGGDAGGVTATECGTTTLITPATSGETCKDGTGTDARFNYPNGVAVDSAGNNVYVADTSNHRIRKITITMNSMNNEVITVSTLAGGGITGTPCDGTTGITITCRDGAGNVAQFSSPSSVAVDGSGNVYVTDRANNRIRKITVSGTMNNEVITVSTLTASTHGAGNVAQFNQPGGITVDSANNLYVANTESHLIYKITPSGVANILAGSGLTNGPLNTPYEVAVDKSGNIYVADTDNHRIRKINIPQ